MYETYREYMYWASYSVVRDEYDAEDIVHNSFLKVGRVLDEIDLDNEEKTKMYLITVARNTAIDYYRKKQRMNEVEGINASDLLEEILDVRHPENIVIDHLNYQSLIQKIGELPKKYADILILFYLFDLSVKEIAIQLSLSEANAYTRMCRAKSLLRQEMGEE